VDFGLNQTYQHVPTPRLLILILPVGAIYATHRAIFAKAAPAPWLAFHTQLQEPAVALDVAYVELSSSVSQLGSINHSLSNR
jgi:hypothetical protein